MKWIIFILSILAIAGCQENPQSSLDPTLDGFFPEDSGEIRKPTQFADLQAASGARYDAMLGKAHFDGPALNSLGEAKLNYMLQDDDSPGPLSVFLTLDEKHALTKARQAAVVTYLKDRGLRENQISVAFGDNPDTRNPAAPRLKDMAKADSTGAGGAESPKEAPAGVNSGGATEGGSIAGTGIK